MESSGLLFGDTINAGDRVQANYRSQAPNAKAGPFNGVRNGDGMTHGTRRFPVIEKPIALC
jgi:hypothetical protein